MCAARHPFKVLSPSPSTLLKTSPRQPVQKILFGTPSTPRNFASSRQLTIASPCSLSSLGRIKKRLDLINSPQAADTSISVRVPSFESPQEQNIQKQRDENLRFPNIRLTDLFSPSKFEGPLNSPHCLMFHQKKFNSPLYTPDRKEKFLGRGSFGNVTLCTYKRRQYALKVVRRKAKMQVGEINLVGVTHAHLVKIFQVVETVDNVFVCMEFGGHLNLQQILDSNGQLTLDRRIKFAQQVATGLNHCHTHKILHLDVKPANVIVNPFGVCKLGDFGLSKKLPLTVLVKTLIGTAAYAAPEALQGHEVTTAADIFSYGIFLWQIYTKQIPYASLHPHIIIYKVVSQDTRPIFEEPKTVHGQTLINLAKRCWPKEPRNRIGLEEVLSTLNELCLSKIISGDFKI